MNAVELLHLATVDVPLLSKLAASSDVSRRNHPPAIEQV
eukprot:CAMPEP_0184360324 /NCGR_PEP_ID=MMETSP1089-20130417/124508_1 /TAXON_ID=38269 ORGANISM="Gloeochaete wittrockiana, Strain SAG46.84" /NCGR_SAMPLE_ID=MMETSP1089 /ASSEMBLY_ACC=CAM_ASM_000445 /LENGTH=38 /DNA_ID= /DNA_START= /DNA_END= /DNA_ORIENTATION=